MCRYKSYLIMMIGQAEKMSHDEDRNKESERERERTGGTKGSGGWMVIQRS